MYTLVAMYLLGPLYMFVSCVCIFVILCKFDVFLESCQLEFGVDLSLILDEIVCSKHMMSIGDCLEMLCVCCCVLITVFVCIVFRAGYRL